jgi:hypothetical protein
MVQCYVQWAAVDLRKLIPRLEQKWGVTRGLDFAVLGCSGVVWGLGSVAWGLPGPDWREIQGK